MGSSTLSLGKNRFFGGRENGELIKSKLGRKTKAIEGNPNQPKDKDGFETKKERTKAEAVTFVYRTNPTFFNHEMARSTV